MNWNTIYEEKSLNCNRFSSRNGRQHWTSLLLLERLLLVRALCIIVLKSSSPGDGNLTMKIMKPIGVWKAIECISCVISQKSLNYNGIPCWVLVTRLVLRLTPWVRISIWDHYLPIVDSLFYLILKDLSVNLPFVMDSVLTNWLISAGHVGLVRKRCW